MDFILFEPIYKERIWGSDNFKSLLQRPLPDGKLIGESWEIVDREDDKSVISNGQLKGKTIREVLETHSAEIMGPGWDKNRPFPVLVKWLDCNDRLSIQVHPPESVAKDLGGEPKTENWYVASAKPDATLIAGLKEGTTKEKFEESLKNGDLEECLERHNVSSGDSFFIQSGCVHAIEAGILILEIQQNSDTTYRVYDWGRVDGEGNSRQLHIEESLKSVDYSLGPVNAIKSTSEGKILADCANFRIQKHILSDKPLIFKKNEQPRIISVVEGSAKLTNEDSVFRRIFLGSNVFLPFSGSFSLESEEKSTIIVVDNFTKN